MGLLALSCAGAPKRAESPPARLKNSAPEKAAAQKSAAPGSLQLEAEDERWGVEAAKERKRAEEERRAAAKPATGGAGGKGMQVVPPANPP
jgi:hypothetical protein